jgi:hypothetical protein
MQFATETETAPMRLTLVLSTLLLAPLLPMTAAAQSHGSEAVFCESRNQAYRECRLGFHGEAVLLEQTSRARCREGRTWGQRRDRVWVGGGCAGWFGRAAPPPPPVVEKQVITCESRRGRRNVCDTPGWRGIELVREHSRNACREGRSYGFDRGSIWVDAGCRADFVRARRGPPQAPPPQPDPPIQGGEVVCTSQFASFKQCPVPGWNGARMVRVLKGRCEEGRSWGFANEAIWVHYDCSAVFVAGHGTGMPPGGDPGYARVTCESRDGRRHECRADIGQAAVWLDRQTSQVLCVAGRNWGWNARAIWVDGGCGGVFTIQRPR